MKYKPGDKDWVTFEYFKDNYPNVDIDIFLDYRIDWDNKMIYLGGHDEGN